MIPDNFPQKGPACYFLHEELYHPNISQSDKKICLGDYFQCNCESSITLNEVINQIYNILQLPCYEDSYDKVIEKIIKLILKFSIKLSGICKKIFTKIIKN